MKNDKLKQRIRDRFGSQVRFGRAIKATPVFISRVVHYDRAVKWKKGERERWSEALGLEISEFDRKGGERICNRCNDREVGEGLWRKCAHCHNEDTINNAGSFYEMAVRLILL